MKARGAEQVKALRVQGAKDAAPKGKNIKRWLRGIVSQNKQRLKNEKFDLDLTYITPRIIAMGYPAVGFEQVYRNPRKEVQEYLQANHKDKFMVYNLCAEPQYQYEPEVFGKGKCAQFAFEDHNPAFLHIVEDFCGDVEKHLLADPEHVVVVHCKAGRGRTGFMISCLLLYLGVVSTAEDAITRFTKKRVKEGKALNNPSQIRFVQHWEKLLRIRFRHHVDSQQHPKGVASVPIPDSPSSPQICRSPLSTVSLNPRTPRLSENIAAGKQSKTTPNKDRPLWGESPLKPPIQLRPRNASKRVRIVGTLSNSINLTHIKLGKIGSSFATKQILLVLEDSGAQVMQKCVTRVGDNFEWKYESPLPAFSPARHVSKAAAIKLSGDVRLQGYEGSSKNGKLLFRIWFNTRFIENNELILDKGNIDIACKEKDIAPDASASHLPGSNGVLFSQGTKLTLAFASPETEFSAHGSPLQAPMRPALLQTPGFNLAAATATSFAMLTSPCPRPRNRGSANQGNASPPGDLITPAPAKKRTASILLADVKAVRLPTPPQRWDTGERTNLDESDNANKTPTMAVPTPAVLFHSKEDISEADDRILLTHDPTFDDVYMTSFCESERGEGGGPPKCPIDSPIPVLSFRDSPSSEASNSPGQKTMQRLAPDCALFAEVVVLSPAQEITESDTGEYHMKYNANNESLLIGNDDDELDSQDLTRFQYNRMLDDDENSLECQAQTEGAGRKSFFNRNSASSPNQDFQEKENESFADSSAGESLGDLKHIAMKFTSNRVSQHQSAMAQKRAKERASDLHACNAKIKKIFEEWVAEESRYSDNLNALVTHFVRPLVKMSRRHTMTAVYRHDDLIPFQVSSAFGNVETIASYSQRLLHSLITIQDMAAQSSSTPERQGAGITCLNSTPMDGFFIAAKVGDALSEAARHKDSESGALESGVEEYDKDLEDDSGEWGPLVMYREFSANWESSLKCTKILCGNRKVKKFLKKKKSYGRGGLVMTDLMALPLKRVDFYRDTLEALQTVCEETIVFVDGSRKADNKAMNAQQNADGFIKPSSQEETGVRNAELAVKDACTSLRLAAQAARDLIQTIQSMTDLVQLQPDIVRFDVLKINKFNKNSQRVLDVDVTLKVLTLRKKISDQVRKAAESTSKKSPSRLGRFKLGVTLGWKGTTKRTKKESTKKLGGTGSRGEFSPAYGATLSAGFQPEQLQRTREALAEEKEIDLPPQTIFTVAADPNDGKKLKLVYVDRSSEVSSSSSGIHKNDIKKNELKLMFKTLQERERFLRMYKINIHAVSIRDGMHAGVEDEESLSNLSSVGSRSKAARGKGNQTDPKAHVPHPFLMKNGHQEWRASSFQHSVKRIKLHGRCLGNAHPLDYKQMVSSLVENPRNWKPWQFWLYLPLGESVGTSTEKATIKQEQLVTEIFTSTIACLSSMGFEINKKEEQETTASDKQGGLGSSEKSLAGRVPAELHYLMDHLAQNVHAAWAYKLSRYGWTFDSKFNFGHKKISGLVPFRELPSEETKLLGIAACAFVNSILSSGYDMAIEGRKVTQGEWSGGIVEGGTLGRQYRNQSMSRSRANSLIRDVSRESSTLSTRARTRSFAPPPRRSFAAPSNASTASRAGKFAMPASRPPKASKVKQPGHSNKGRRGP